MQFLRPHRGQQAQAASRHTLFSACLRTSGGLACSLLGCAGGGVASAMASRGSPRFQLTAKEHVVINLIVWLVVGGLIGWIASMIMRTDAQQGVGLNIIVGIVGALIAGFVVSPLLGLPTINEGAFSAGSLVVSLIGAVILLAIVNLFRRGRVR
jgi:uncharacterized membrane protein YeaQ/YmgE (transglycosylase-associated protein family)